jgi:ribosome maturation factor RimP
LTDKPTDTGAIARLIEPAVKEMGLDLVRVAMIGGKSDPTLQVMAERPETRQLTIDDCADLSRRIGDILDEADPIEEGYRLEVSSPGIDRPLTKAKDYERFLGHEAKVETNAPIEGRKRFKGPIKAVDARAVELTVEGVDIRIPFADIHKAKLVLTDALIKLHQANEEQAELEIEQKDD